MFGVGFGPPQVARAQSGGGGGGPPPPPDDLVSLSVTMTANLDVTVNTVPRTLASWQTVGVVFNKVFSPAGTTQPKNPPTITPAATPLGNGQFRLQNGQTYHIILRQ